MWETRVSARCARCARQAARRHQAGVALPVSAPLAQLPLYVPRGPGEPCGEHSPDPEPTACGRPASACLIGPSEPEPPWIS